MPCKDETAAARDAGVGPWARRAAGEITAALDGVDDGAVDALVAALARALTGARRIALHGVGREGLMMRALAMRLYHLGFDAHAVGEMTTPPVGEGDWLLVSAGPGRFATVEALATVAATHGAAVGLFTARAEAALAASVDLVVTLPARTMAADGRGAVLPMGSAYEGALFMLCEYLVARLGAACGVDEAAMRARHTNLE